MGRSARPLERMRSLLGPSSMLARTGGGGAWAHGRGGVAVGEAVGEGVVLARAVVDVGEDGGRVLVVEPADVLVAARADAPLRLVGDGGGLLGADSPPAPGRPPR